LLSYEIRSWSLRFRQFDICQVNIAQSNTLVHSIVPLMIEIWCKNIHAFLRYSSFRVGVYYFASPCIVSETKRFIYRKSAFFPPFSHLNFIWSPHKETYDVKVGIKRARVPGLPHARWNPQDLTVIIFTARCDASAVYAVTQCLSVCPSVCPSVRLSVCPSVTFVDHV